MSVALKDRMSELDRRLAPRTSGSEVLRALITLIGCLLLGGALGGTLGAVMDRVSSAEPSDVFMIGGLVFGLGLALVLIARQRRP